MLYGDAEYFRVLSMKFASYQPPSAQDFEVAARFLENSCTTILGHRGLMNKVSFSWTVFAKQQFFHSYYFISTFYRTQSKFLKFQIPHSCHRKKYHGWKRWQH
jgi:hypothetical protein